MESHVIAHQQPAAPGRHGKAHSFFPLAQGWYLADHIAGARLVELPGGEGLFGSDSDAVADEIQRFLRHVQTSA